MSTDKINSFTDLLAWQKSHELTVAVFKIFKSAKNNNLRSQIERSSLSVTSNIAEGFGRSSQKDKDHFYVMARGSAFEVQSQLFVARDIADITQEEFVELLNKSVDSIKLLHGLIRSLRG